MFRTFLTCMALTVMASIAHGATDTLRNPVPHRAEAAAKAAMEACGYRNVKNLSHDPIGNWVAEAERGGVEIAIVLQINGEIAEEKSVGCDLHC